MGEIKQLRKIVSDDEILAKAEKLADQRLAGRLDKQRRDLEALAMQAANHEEWEAPAFADLAQVEHIFRKMSASDSAEREFRRWNDASYLAAVLTRKDPRLTKVYRDGLARPEIAKAMDSATSNEGAEWVPTAMSSEVWDLVRTKMPTGSLFREIPMPTSPYKAPRLTGDASVYLTSENTGDTPTKFSASTPDTDNAAVSAIKLTVRVLASGELVEDAIPGFVDQLQGKIATALGRAIEDAVVNGDDSGTHMDYDTANGAATLPAKSWKGLRKLAPGASDVSLATLNAANLRSMRYAMGAAGSDPSDLVYLCSAKVAIKLLALTEIISLERYGASASETLIPGEIGRLDGVPIIVSGSMRDNVAASGVNTMAGPNTKSSIILVNRAQLALGTRRMITARSFANPETDMLSIAVSWRGVFFPLSDSSANALAVRGVNVAP